MEKLVLFIAAASGLWAVSLNPERQYHFVYEQKNWTEALSHCRLYYTDLANIENIEDVKTLNDMVDLNKFDKSADSYRAWIGLYNDVNSWRWSRSDSDLYRSDEAEFRNWKPGQPDNEGGHELCAEIFVSGEWNDKRCDKTLSAICSDVRGQNVTFVFIDKTMTWTQAQSYCRAHHTDLASVRNMSENQRVKELVPAEDRPVWIGLFRDSWKWTDGRTSTFRYWKTKEPNNQYWRENCVAAYFKHSGNWEDWNCDWNKPFVCYSEPVYKQAVRLRLEKNAHLDLNRAAVMDDMLKLVKQKLQAQGVRGDINLSWRKQSDGNVFHSDTKKTKKIKIP
ncbi:unnamed protein product [Oreochromis niloticus]|nr:unnamed protein product [Mustela putorius furo]